MKKILFTVLLSSLALCFFTSCGKNTKNTIKITDMEGTIVNVPENVSNVACISQSATDFMIAFGLGDKIVGTYRSFTYNPWVAEIYPKAKDFKAYSYSVSAEELLSDGIDLVITQDTENAESFRNAGLPVVAVHQYSPTGKFDDEIYDTARIIGDIFGEDVKKKATAWENDVKNTIKEIQEKIGTVNLEKLVYYVNGEKAKGLYYSDGGNSMISEIFEIANVRLATEKYEVLNVHKVSDEEMVALNPYAMMIGGTYQSILFDSLNESPIWSELTCNKENRVYRIPVAMVGIENVSCETPVMLRYVASLFNDSYDYNLIEGLKGNIKEYFNYNLSDQDAINMCSGLTKDGKRTVNAK